jgi:hypothetical protein
VGEWREWVGGCATFVTIVAGETGGGAAPTGARVMVAATGWRGGFVALREVKWAVLADAASGDGWEAAPLAWERVVVGPGVGGVEEEEEVHSIASAFLSNGEGLH